MERRWIPVICLSLLFLLNLGSLNAQGEGWKIKFQIQDLPNARIKIGYQFGKTRFLLDSAVTDKKGNFVFEGDSTLEHGVYLIFLPMAMI